MKDIKGFEGLYAINEEGNVWSYPRSVERKGHLLPIGGLWLKPTLMQVGYSMVTLYDRENKPHKKLVHRLVAEAFLQKLEVNHKNGIKTDNRVENLEWITPSQNSLHARQVLRIDVPRGERHKHAKLTDEKVREIRRLRKEKNLEYKVLGTMFGVDNSVISRIVNRQYWTHVE